MLARSHIIRTKPLGLLEQPDFLNGAVMIETDLSFSDLQCYLKALEQRLGRVHLPDKNGPRTIDLDVVVWNDTVVNDDYYERDFLANLVAELMIKRHVG